MTCLDAKNWRHMACFSYTQSQVGAAVVMLEKWSSLCATAIRSKSPKLTKDTLSSNVDIFKDLPKRF